MSSMLAVGLICTAAFSVVILHITPTNGQINNSSDNATREQTSHVLNHLLNPSRYDKRFRPMAKGPPVEVKCDIFINSFDSITEATMDYGVSIFMRQRWADGRLCHNDTEPIFLHEVNRIWTPDAFFPNEKDGHLHTVTVENQIVRIYPDGQLLYSTRYSLKLSCYMSLHSFPMDSQVCRIRLESYGYTTKDLKFEWNVDKPIQKDDELKLPQFGITGMVTKNCTKEYSTGTFSCIEAEFYLDREVGYYILQAYLPSIILVVLSWVSFWISYEAAPARVALGVTTILTLTTLDAGIRSQLPKVSYPKAIDIWMAVCLVFVFAALVEFAGVNYISIYQKKLKKQRDEEKKFTEEKELETKKSDQNNGGDFGYENIEMDTLERNKQTPSPNESTAVLNKTTNRLQPLLTADNIDRVSRIIFPLIFISFNAIYWPSLLSR